MKQRLADYVADFLVAHGITDCFTVVGGGAMHLNDALGHKEGLHCTYNHHEQGSAIAAEAYARLNNKKIVELINSMIPQKDKKHNSCKLKASWDEQEEMLLVNVKERCEDE